MGPLLSKIRGDIRQAMLDHNDLKKDILRVVVGEVQRKLDADKDEDVVRAIRKIIEGNLESLTHLDNPKLKKENEILTEYLPVLWSEERTRASLTPYEEQIKKATNPGAAIGVAMKVLKTLNAPVDSKIVQEIVKGMRI